MIFLEPQSQLPVTYLDLSRFRSSLVLRMFSNPKHKQGCLVIQHLHNILVFRRARQVAEVNRRKCQNFYFELLRKYRKIYKRPNKLKILVCISLMLGMLNFFSLHLSDICVSSFEKCVFVLFAHLIGSVVQILLPYQLCMSAKISTFCRFSSFDYFLCCPEGFKFSKIPSVSGWLYFLSNWRFF